MSTQTPRTSITVTTAYAFSHTDNIASRVAQLFGEQVQFDVIVGKPPYQLDEGGFGASAGPIYGLVTPRPRFSSGIGVCQWKES